MEQYLRLEKFYHILQSLDERVDVGLRIIHREAGSGGGGEGEDTVQRRGTMFAGTDTDIAFAEHLCDVVRMNAFKREGNDTTVTCILCSENTDVIPERFTKCGY